MEITLIILYAAAGITAGILLVFLVRFEEDIKRLKNSINKLAAMRGDEKEALSDFGVMIERLSWQAKLFEEQNRRLEAFEPKIIEMQGRARGIGEGLERAGADAGGGLADFAEEPEEAKRARELRAFYEGIGNVLGYDGRGA